MFKKFNKLKQKKIILAFSFVLLVIHLFFTFSGFYGDDDINYARYAADIINGNVHSPSAIDHFQLRWSTIYSVALFYYVFGINAFTSAIPSLLSFIFCGLLIYKILVEEKNRIFFLTVLFFYFNRTSIFYMHRLLADPIMSFAIFYMYFLYRSYLLNQIDAVKRSLLFAISFFLAIITKETIIIAAPLFIGLFVKDIIKKQYLQFWKYAILFCALFLGFYLLYFKITTGDYFYRYHLLIHTNEISSTNFENVSEVEKLNRIGYSLYNAWLLNGDMLLYIPAFTAFFYRKILYTTTIKNLDAYSFLVLLFCANFMTISFSNYIPLPESPRHFIFLIPFASLLASKILFEYFNDPKRFILLPLLLMLATIIVFGEKGGSTKYMYLAFTLITASRYFLAYYKTKNVVSYYILATTCLFLLNYLIDFYKPMYPGYFDQKKVITSAFAGKNINGTVYSANVFASEMNEYFLGFKTKELNFLPLDSFKSEYNKPLFLYINSDENSYESKIIKNVGGKSNKQSISILAYEKQCYLYNVNNKVLQMLRDSIVYNEIYKFKK